MPISKNLERQIIAFLEELRESGRINMYGAVPYIVEEFNISESDARKVLLRWMDYYNKFYSSR